MRSHVFAGVGLLALLAANDALAQTELVINSFGGAYERKHRELVIEPFEKANNVKVTVTTVYSADMVAQLRAQKAAPRFDIVHLSGGLEATAAAEGLLAPIKPEQLANYADLYPFAVQNIAKGEGPAYSAAVVGMLYDANKAKPAPQSWLDIANPAYAGHLVLTDLSNNWGLLSFLMINKVAGGTLDNITPGLDIVKKSLAGATVLSKSPEIQQAFAQSDAWVAPYAQDYAFTPHAGRTAGEVHAAQGRRGVLADLGESRRRSPQPGAGAEVHRLLAARRSVGGLGRGVPLRAGESQGGALGGSGGGRALGRGGDEDSRHFRSDQDRSDARRMDRAMESRDREVTLAVAETSSRDDHAMRSLRRGARRVAAGR